MTAAPAPSTPTPKAASAATAKIMEAKARAAAQNAPSAPAIAPSPPTARKAATTTTAAPAPGKSKKSHGGAISAARAYQTFQPRMTENGIPNAAAIFRASAAAATPITDETHGEFRRAIGENGRFSGTAKNLPQDDLIKDINDAVNRRVFGTPLAFREAKAQLQGIFHRLLELADQGYNVKTLLGILAKVDTDARTARNPKTGETINVPAGKTMRFRVSSTVKKFARAGG